jgi:hypothetical protein
VIRLIGPLINELRDAISRDDYRNIWADPGKRELDAALQNVADDYIDFPEVREAVRSQLREVGSLWSLVLFVRRVGLLMKTPEGEQWLKRGLAVASMVDAKCDYRDLIVSLVILRSLAMGAGLSTDAAFDEAIGWSTERMHGILRNARNHAEADIRSTLAAFGPPPRSER